MITHWPPTLKIFSAMLTDVMNICAKFHTYPATKYRDITSCCIDVNGQRTDTGTDRLTDNLKTWCSMPATVSGGRLLVTLIVHRITDSNACYLTHNWSHPSLLPTESPHRPWHNLKTTAKSIRKIWKSCQHCDAACHISVIYNCANCTALLSMQYPQQYLSFTDWDFVTAKNPEQELSSNSMQCTNYWYKSLYSITVMHTCHK